MSENETEVITLLQRMQQQLTFLEKKLDTLLQQSQRSQPFKGPNRSFSKPFRPYGRPPRPNHQGFGHGPSSQGQAVHGHRGKNNS
jgi:hypothetical protein